MATRTRTDTFFLIVFTVLLLSFPWNNNVSSWAGVLFSLWIFSTTTIGYQLVVQNKSFLFPVLYFIYFSVPFAFSDREETDFSVLLDNSPFVLFPFIFATHLLRGPTDDFARFLKIFALGITAGFAGCFFYALYAFWNEFYLFLNGYIPVTTLIGMHPSYFSMFVSFSFVIVVDHALTNFRSMPKSQRAMYGAWLFVLAFAVLYIRSRTGVLSFLIILIFIILYQSPRRLRIWLLCGLCVGVLALYTVIELTAFHKGRFQVAQISDGIRHKQMQWQASWNIIKENPIFGVTAISAQARLSDEYRKLGYDEGIVSRFNSHNQFLTTLIEGGIVGFMLLFTPVFMLFLAGAKRGNMLMLCFVLLMSLAFLTETMLHRHKGIFFFITFLLLLHASLWKKEHYEYEGSVKA